MRTWSLLVLALILGDACTAEATALRTSPMPSSCTEYAGWSWRESFGVRFSVPTDWIGPQDIRPQETGGAPRNWLTFSDATGTTQVSVWLIDDAAQHFATTRLTAQGSDRKNVTISDAGERRDVIEVDAGPTGPGTFIQRHLVVPLTTTLAVDVWLSAPPNGSRLSAEQMRVQDRIAIRLSPIPTSPAASGCR